MLKHSDYENALKFISNEISKFPKNLQPKSLYRAGNIGSPGISDLDLIFSFKDDFCYGKQFIDLFNKVKFKIKYHEILFLHLPLIFPNSLLKQLPYFSFNPTNELDLISGEEVLYPNVEISNEQILLRSLEFLHARIIDLLIQLSTRNTDQKSILVVGHSFIHSLNALKKINSELTLNSKTFKTFCKIEEYRKYISSGKELEISKKDCENLYKGICAEFYQLLNYFYDEVEKKIAFHWSENFEYYRYHDNIILRNLNKRSTDLNIIINNGIAEIKGFSWEMKCISDNYFFGEKEYSTIFLDEKFKKEIAKKREFLKSIYQFNMLNFGNSFGRSSFRTFALDRVQDYLSIRM